MVLSKSSAVLAAGLLIVAAAPMAWAQPANTRAVATPAENTRAVATPVEKTRAVAIPTENTRAVVTPVENTQAVATPVENTRAVGIPAENTRAVTTPAENTRAVATQATSVTGEVPLDEYLGALAAINPAARDGAQAYLDAYRTRCGKALSTLALRQAVAEGNGDPALMAVNDPGLKPEACKGASPNQA